VPLPAPMVRLCVRSAFTAERKNVGRTENPMTRSSVPFGSPMLIAAFTSMMLGCGGETKLEDLDEPVLWWQRSSGLCSAFVAIDGNRRVWEDRGCETPVDFEVHGKVAADTQTAIAARFDSLPSNAVVTRSECGGELHMFGRRRDGQSTGWTVCGSRSGADELTGLQEPFLGLALAFVAVR